MSLINLGSQILTFDYKKPAKARNFNKFLHGTIKPGIYDGGTFSLNIANICTIAPFISVLNVDDDKIVYARTQESFDFTILAATPIVYITYDWLETDINWLNFNQRAIGSTPATNEIILCTAQFSGETITGFDYSNRTFGLIDQSGNVNVENTLYIGEQLDSYFQKSATNEITTNAEIKITDSVAITNNLTVAELLILKSDITVAEVITNTLNSEPPYIINSSTVIPNLNVSTVDGAELDTDATMAADSDVRISSQKAISTLTNAKMNLFTRTSIYNWNLENAAEDNAWTSICWSSELSKFVAVSYDGTNRVMYSSEGINWTSASAATVNSWTSVCWSPELSIFVAVAYFTGTNQVMYSSDGITWTTTSAASASQWRSVCWSPKLSIFVAVAISGAGEVMYSSNGITWTSASAAETNQWTSVCWSSELNIFVAVAQDGTNRVMYSDDGINWISASASEANVWRSVCWSPELGLFVAVASTGTNRVMYSSDGITWAASTAEANTWISVCWSPELNLFIAVALYGTNKVMYSSDGITWTSAIVPATNDWRSVCWSSELGLFVIIAETGTNRVMRSF